MAGGDRPGIRDGYGQTETGQLTAKPPGVAPRPGSMGRPLPGMRPAGGRRRAVRRPGHRCRPSSSATSAGPRRRTAPAAWRTGDLVREDEDGYLYFEGRTDDVIISAGYRIGPFEVESALVAHPAVAEAAVVAAPDDERGSVVRAVVVLRDGYAPGRRARARAAGARQAQTAPYKYPRIVEFADELPKTASGKVRRALLRERWRGRGGAGCSRTPSRPRDTRLIDVDGG